MRFIFPFLPLSLSLFFPPPLSLFLKGVRLVQSKSLRRGTNEPPGEGPSCLRIARRTGEKPQPDSQSIVKHVHTWEKTGEAERKSFATHPCTPAARWGLPCHPPGRAAQPARGRMLQAPAQPERHHPPTPAQNDRSDLPTTYMTYREDL